MNICLARKNPCREFLEWGIFYIWIWAEHDTFHFTPAWGSIKLKQKSVNKHVALNETLWKILTASSTWRLYNLILDWSLSIMSWSLSWILRSSSHWKANSFILRSDLRAFFCVSAWRRCSLSNSVSSSRTYKKNMIYVIKICMKLINLR